PAASERDLPPPRRGRALRPVAKPLAHTRLPRLIYALAALAALLCAFYAVRLVRWKADAGGWANLALGRRPPPQQTQPGAPAHGQPGVGKGAGARKAELGLEDHVDAIAALLGMQPTDLAAALSDAVVQHAAPATRSSLAASLS
ncbi:hypothetical protein DFH11DRAFT_1481895, partial [Phellopilus nigrolimitatus]